MERPGAAKNDCTILPKTDPRCSKDGRTNVAYGPGCGGLTGSQATAPVRLVSRRKTLPPCMTCSDARSGPPNAMLAIGVAANSGVLRMFVHRPGCSNT